MQVRGRTLGPYDLNKMQSLARRGQLSRLHEVSTEGLTWQKAANFPELFAGQFLEGPLTKEAPARVGSVAQNVGEAAPAQPSSPVQQEWYYMSGGMQRGPVDFGSLQLLSSTGQLEPGEMVWTEGMSAWAPAGMVPGLITANSAAVGAAQPVVPQSRSPSQPQQQVVVVQTQPRQAHVQYPSTRGQLAPHRGGTILAFGIIGLLLVGPLGLAAWIMGAGDLNQMNSSTMDDSGRGMTQAGMVTGIIATILWAVWVMFWFGVVGRM